MWDASNTDIHYLHLQVHAGVWHDLFRKQIFNCFLNVLQIGHPLRVRGTLFKILQPITERTDCPKLEHLQDTTATPDHRHGGCTSSRFIHSLTGASPWMILYVIKNNKKEQQQKHPRGGGSPTHAYQSIGSGELSALVNTWWQHCMVKNVLPLVCQSGRVFAFF